MKRLNWTYHRRRIERRRSGLPEVDEQGWRAYAGRLQRASIQPARVRSVLQRATLDRMLFEDGLEALAENRKDTAYVTRLRRKVRAVDRMRKLVDFLRDESWFFDSWGDKLEARLREYRRKVRLPISSDLISPRGRRLEVWAERAIRELAALSRKHGLSWNRVAAEVHAGLDLFRHGDMITRDQVRHALRRARKQDPLFGRSSGKRRT